METEIKIYLLILLDYKTNSDIVFNNESMTKHMQTKQILSLRHLCILKFKRSIIYHRNQRH